MRPALVILITFGLLGGTWWYTSFVNRIIPVASPFRVKLADEIYSVEIARTFDAMPVIDSETTEFTVDKNGMQKDSALVVLFKGETILNVNDFVSASEPIIISAIPGIEVGKNEIFIKANLTRDQSAQFHAMQVKVLRGNREIITSTLSSYPECRLIYGTIRIDVPEDSEF